MIGCDGSWLVIIGGDWSIAENHTASVLWLMWIDVSNFHQSHWTFYYLIMKIGPNVLGPTQWKLVTCQQFWLGDHMQKPEIAQMWDVPVQLGQLEARDFLRWNYTLKGELYHPINITWIGSINQRVYTLGWSISFAHPPMTDDLLNGMKGNNPGDTKEAGWTR